MYRYGTIITKIRPIKKLCVIEENDVDRLVQIIKNYSMELAGVLNLILINDSKLFNDNTIDFVRNHDPDIIINYSSCDNNRLKSLFKTRIIDGTEDGFEWNNVATDLRILNNIEDSAKMIQNDEASVIYANFDTHTDNKNLFYYLNFGLIDLEFKHSLRDSFKDSVSEGIDLRSMQEETLNPIGKLLKLVSTNGINNILFLSIALLWPLFSETISINEIDYNKEENYKKPTIIFGYQDDIESMVYFWNERATYPYLNHKIWLPLENLDEYIGYINKFRDFCIFSKPGDDRSDIVRKVKSMNSSLIEIDNSRFYFRSRSDEWQPFKFEQVVPIIDNKFTIRHPSDKLFSRSGFNINTVLEIDGLEDMNLPKSLDLGKIFCEYENGVVQPSFNDVIQSHIFSRISSKGLAFAFDQLEPFKDNPLIYDVFLPSDKLVFETLFEEHQLQLKETIGSQVIEQVINLINGFENLEIICEERIFNLLVSLAPKRIRRIVKDIVKDIKSVPEDQLESMINKNISPLTTINSNIIINTKDLLERFPKESREKYGNLLEKLYENKVLLRGKSFGCPHCNSTLWYSLSALNDDLKCYCCGNSIMLPILFKSGTLEDSFRLNELISNAVDQGIFSLLLTINFLFKQRFYGKRFLFNNIVCNKVTKTQLGEIDLVFTIGKLIGIAEVKSDRGFEGNQIERLLEISKKIDVDLILFSTLKSKDSIEVQNLVNDLNSQEICTSIFILTKDVLFKKELINLGDYMKGVLSSDHSYKKLTVI